MGGAAFAPEETGLETIPACDALPETSSFSGRPDALTVTGAARARPAGDDDDALDVDRRRWVSSYVSTATPFTACDRAWLRSIPHTKALDPSLRVVSVASRCPSNGTPRVLVCYPLRRTRDARRSETRGYSTNKWNPKVGDAPVPWPNAFWLCCPDLIAAIGKLEHAGWIKKFNARFRFPESEEDVQAANSERLEFARQHQRYAAFRWGLLSLEEKKYCRENKYDAVLENCGVGGLRVPEQVKCLHLHYAHYVATRDNLVGKWCHEALALKDEVAR